MLGLIFFYFVLYFLFTVEELFVVIHLYVLFLVLICVFVDGGLHIDFDFGV